MEVKNTKLLFLYRTCFFRFATFITNNKDLKLIVNALNIKNRRKRIEYIYDEAIKIINKYYYMDLCKFENNRCIAQRKMDLDRINGCCRLCTLVTDKGCPSANMACKLIYCKTALGNVKELKFKDISILKCLSLKERLILRSDFFETREEVINDIYYGIILYGLKAAYREFRRGIYYKIKNLKQKKD